MTGALLSVEHSILNVAQCVVIFIVTGEGQIDHHGRSWLLGRRRAFTDEIQFSLVDGLHLRIGTGDGDLLNYVYVDGTLARCWPSVFQTKGTLSEELQTIHLSKNELTWCLFLGGEHGPGAIAIQLDLHAFRGQQSRVENIGEVSVDGQLIVEDGLVANRTDPRRLPLVHLEEERSVEALQVGTRRSTTGKLHPHFAQRAHEGHFERRGGNLHIRILRQFVFDEAPSVVGRPDAFVP